MIIVKISGGLGNQLFEYAYARVLSHVYDVPLKLDATSYLDKDPDSENPDKVFNRQYILNKFNTVEDFASDKEIRRLKKYQKKLGKIWYLHNKLFADETIYIQERKYNVADKKYLNPPGLELGKAVYLDGFWQTERYFRNYEDLIRKEFSFRYPPNQKNAEVLKKINSTESVCIHIRRGNFLIPKYNNHHGICPSTYYDKAVRKIVEKIPNPTFFVFSDDKEWARENINLKFPTIFVEHNDSEKDYEDLRLMSNCKHHINANSSFSWWGAWLSKDNGIVVMPNKLVKKERDLTNYAPKRWVRIDTELL